MSEWQSIETAPKNTKILVGYPNALGNWRTVTACYYLPRTLEIDCLASSWDGEDDGWAPEGWYEESDSQELIMPTSETPTHWMPLPAPPDLKETKP